MFRTVVRGKRGRHLNRKHSFSYQEKQPLLVGLKNINLILWKGLKYSREPRAACPERKPYIPEDKFVVCGMPGLNCYRTRNGRPPGTGGLGGGSTGSLGTQRSSVVHTAHMVRSSNFS